MRTAAQMAGQSMIEGSSTGTGHVERNGGSAVIFLNRYFYPDHSATSQMLSDLAFALARLGSDPEAGTGAVGGRRIVIVTSRQRYDAPDQQLAPREMIAGVDIHRVWTTRFGRHNLLGRALDYATFYASAAWCLWRLARPGDSVVAKTDPPLLSVVTGPVARACGAHRINWLQDIFPEVAEALGMGGRMARPMFRVLGWLRNRSLRSADVNVALGGRMAERLTALGVPASRIRVISNWADGRQLTPVEPADNALRTAWELQERFVVGYSGNLGRAHEIETLVGAMQVLAAAAKPPDVSWLFIGGGALATRLKEIVSKQRFAHVQFQPYQPRDQLAQSLSAADVHIVSLQPALEGLIVPSKLYGIMAVGRPCIFIGDADGEVARTIARYQCGCVVAQGDAAGLARAIAALAADPLAARRLGLSARAAFEREFDMPIAVAGWFRLLDDVERSSASREALDRAIGTR